MFYISFHYSTVKWFFLQYRILRDILKGPRHYGAILSLFNFRTSTNAGAAKYKAAPVFVLVENSGDEGSRSACVRIASALRPQAITPGREILP
jgi:hypothetical protein